MLVPDLEGGYTAYEIRYGDDPFEDGVPFYHTNENPLAPGRHTWLVNYAALDVGVSPDWKDSNWKVETIILQKRNIENFLPMQQLRIDDSWKRPVLPPGPAPKRTKTANPRVPEENQSGGVPALEDGGGDGMCCSY